MGRLKIRTFTSEIERMQVFCAQMHVFTPFSVGANVNTKKVFFFSSNSALVRTAHTYIRVYDTV
jgi:hypothetical protein